MGLHVCPYPGCRTTTILEYCKEHADQAMEDDELELETTPEPARPRPTADDLISRVMSVAAHHPATPKKEPQKKEKIMARCTKGQCPDEAAEDSVRCPKHRDMQRAYTAKFQGRALPAGGKPKRKYTRRQPVGSAAPTAVALVPAKRANAPIVLAEPTIVNGKPVRHADLDGNVLTILDAAIQTYASDHAALVRAKEILEARA